MDSWWQVKKVTSTTESTLAELVQMVWFKTNPEFTQWQRDEKGECPEEWVDCTPLEEGADSYPNVDGRMTIDITDEEIRLVAGDDILLRLNRE